MTSTSTRKVSIDCVQRLTDYRPWTVKPSRSTNAEGMVGSDLRRIRSSPRLVACTALLLLHACGGDDLLLPHDGEPARVAAVNQDSLTATVGQPLGDSLVAEVTD